MNYYVRKDTVVNGRQLHEGQIINAESLDGQPQDRAEQIEYLVREGYAEESNIPQLTEFAAQAKMALNKAEKMKEAILNDKRYDDAPSLRDGMLEDQDLKLAEEIAEIEKAYNERLQSMESELLAKLSEPSDYSEEDNKRASVLINELNFGGGLAEVEKQLPHVSDGTKQALLARISELDIDANEKKRLYSELRDGQASYKEARKKLAHVRAYATSYEPLAVYKVRMMARKAMKKRQQSESV